MEGFTFELMNCEAILLQEIAEPRCKQKSIIMTYGLALRSSERDRINWRKVNEAIIARWSFSGLNRIKNAAWKGPSKGGAA